MEEIRPIQENDFGFLKNTKLAIFYMNDNSGVNLFMFYFLQFTRIEKSGLTSIQI